MVAIGPRDCPLRRYGQNIEQVAVVRLVVATVLLRVEGMARTSLSAARRRATLGREAGSTLDAERFMTLLTLLISVMKRPTDRPTDQTDRSVGFHACTRGSAAKEAVVGMSV